MQERLSVLKRARAWSTSSFAAAVGSEIVRTRSTASWSEQTSHNYSLYQHLSFSQMSE
jgi:hypothetical protein